MSKARAHEGEKPEKRRRMIVGVPGTMSFFASDNPGRASAATLRETKEVYAQSLVAAVDGTAAGSNSNAASLRILQQYGACVVARVSMQARIEAWNIATQSFYVGMCISAASAYIGSRGLVVVTSASQPAQHSRRKTNWRAVLTRDRQHLPPLYDELKVNIYRHLMTQGLAVVFFRKGADDTLLPVMLHPSRYEIDVVIIRDTSGPSTQSYMVHELVPVTVQEADGSQRINWVYLHRPEALIFTAANGLNWEPDVNGQLCSPVARCIPLVRQYNDTTHMSALSARMRVNPTFIMRKSDKTDDSEARAREMMYRDSGDAASLARAVAQPNAAYIRSSESLFAPDRDLMRRTNMAVQRKAVIADAGNDVAQFVASMAVFEQNREKLGIMARGAASAGDDIMSAAAGMGMGPSKSTLDAGVASAVTQSQLPDPLHPEGWDQNILLVPRGFEMQPSHIPPEVGADITEREGAMETKISGVLNIPRHLVVGETRASHHENLASVLIVNETFETSLHFVKKSIGNIITEIFAYATLAYLIKHQDDNADEDSVDDNEEGNADAVAVGAEGETMEFDGNMKTIGELVRDRALGGFATMQQNVDDAEQKEWHRTDMASFSEVMHAVDVDGGRLIRVEFEATSMAAPEQIIPLYQSGFVKVEAVHAAVREVYGIPDHLLDKHTDLLTTEDKTEFLRGTFGASKGVQPPTSGKDSGLKEKYNAARGKTREAGEKLRKKKAASAT